LWSHLPGDDFAGEFIEHSRQIEPLQLKARTVARGLPALLQGLLKMLFFAKQSHLIPAARPRLRSGDLSYNGWPGWYYALLRRIAEMLLALEIRNGMYLPIKDLC
jgi:hypothetical protein